MKLGYGLTMRGIIKNEDDEILILKRHPKSKTDPEMWELPKQSKMGIVYDDKLYTKKAQLGAPSLISPYVSDDTVVYASEVNLKWSPAYARSGFRVEVATDENFENIVYSYETPLLQATFTDVMQNQKYYWRVVSVNWSNSMDDKEVSSKVGSFRIASQEEIAAKADVETFELKIIVDE